MRTVFRAEEVFTATAIPQATYVEREEVSARLVNQLRQRGRPICLVGPHRSGKTTLALTKIRQLFERHVHVICKRGGSSFEGLLLDAFDALSPHYAQESVEKRGTIPSGVSAEFFGLKAQLGGGSKEHSGKLQRVLPPQLTTRTFASFCAAANAPWIIDDVHNLSEEDLAKLADTMREWQTLDLEYGNPKIVVVASEHLAQTVPRSLLQSAPDLRQRLAVLTLSQMTSSEIAEIVQRGATAMNADFSSVQDQVVEYSFGFPGVCQDLCYHMCLAAGIEQTPDSRISIQAHHLQEALAEYILVCEQAIDISFDEMTALELHDLPAGFSKVTLDYVAKAGLAGVSIQAASDFLAEALDIPPMRVVKGLDLLADDDAGVLRIDLRNDLLSFKEPMYLVYYRARLASKTDEVRHRELVRRFVEVISEG